MPEIAPVIDKAAYEVLVTEQLIKALLVVHPPTVAVSSEGKKIDMKLLVVRALVVVKERVY